MATGPYVAIRGRSCWPSKQEEGMPCVSVRRGRLGVERTCGEPGASGGTSSWHASGRRWIRNQGADLLPPLPFLSYHACLVDASLLLGSAFDTSLSSRGNRWKRNHRQP